MNRAKEMRRIGGFALLIVLALCLFVLNLMLGSGSLRGTVLFDVLSGRDPDPMLHRILFDIRLPRAIAAFLLGGALSVSGFLLQSFFRNPIAGPFVLGISSGAKLTVALLMIAVSQNQYTASASGMVAAAFAGSLIAMGAVLLLSGKVRNMAQLIIAGVMIGYICNAVTELVITFADESNIVNLHNWSRGSFSGIGRPALIPIFMIVIVSLIGTILLAKPISAYQLGESYAQNAGVNLKLLRAGMILLSSLLSACVTAFAGPISFVGIAVPHLVKALFGTARPLIIIPASFLGGAVFCTACDMLARMLFAPTELSVSTVTAVFGAPIVIQIMLHRNAEKRGGHNG